MDAKFGEIDLSKIDLVNADCADLVARTAAGIYFSRGLPHAFDYLSKVSDWQTRRNCVVGLSRVLGMMNLLSALNDAVAGDPITGNDLDVVVVVSEEDARKEGE
jgi:hypothetical protein